MSALFWKHSTTKTGKLNEIVYKEHSSSQTHNTHKRTLNEITKVINGKGIVLSNNNDAGVAAL